MALSTLLRGARAGAGPVCMNRVLGQQVMRLATRPAPLRCGNISPIKSLLTNETKATTPLLNAVRAFRTSALRLSAEKPHDHSRLWVIEKAVSALLVPLIPIALFYPSKTFDSILAVALVAHIFWGFEAIAVDYVRAILFGPVIPKIALGLVYVMCIATLGGLFYVIQHDIGIANTIRQVWSIKPLQNC